MRLKAGVRAVRLRAEMDRQGEPQSRMEVMTHDIARSLHELLELEEAREEWAQYVHLPDEPSWRNLWGRLG